MSPELLSIITVFGAGILSTILTYFTAMYVNKKKVPAEVDKLKADTSLTGGELIRKYQEIAEKQADENLSLQSQIKAKEEEKKTLATAIEQLKEDIARLKTKYDSEIAEINRKFDDERIEHLKWKDWSSRLVLQLQSFRIQPTPFDIDKAKKDGFNLGEYGSNRTE